MAQLEEEWRDITGHEGSYQISSFGRVKSLARRVWMGNRWGSIKERILTPLVSGRYKYHMVQLGAGNQRYVHRLVLETFVGPCKDGMEACHFPDKSRSNNRLDNLRWATHLENMVDRDKHGSLRTGCMKREFSAEYKEKMSFALKKYHAARRGDACSLM